jgi:hypothetical protein
MAMTAAPPASVLLPEGRYDVDGAASTVRFAVGHFGVQTVRGTLDGLRGCVAVADGRLVAHGSVDAATLRTGTRARDAHVRSFLLAADRFPRLELRTDAPLAPEVPATLLVRGRPLTVLVALRALGGDGLRADLRLDRRAARLGWPLLLDRAVGRHVDVTLTLRLRPA